MTTKRLSLTKFDRTTLTNENGYPELIVWLSNENTDAVNIRIRPKLSRPKLMRFPKYACAWFGPIFIGWIPAL